MHCSVFSVIAHAFGFRHRMLLSPIVLMLVLAGCSPADQEPDFYCQPSEEYYEEWLKKVRESRYIQPKGLRALPPLAQSFIDHLVVSGLEFTKPADEKTLNSIAFDSIEELKKRRRQFVPPSEQSEAASIAIIDYLELDDYLYEHDYSSEIIDSGIQYKHVKGSILITAVAPNSPGDRAGIKPGRLVHRVDRKKVYTLARSDIRARLAGKSTSAVLLQVEGKDGDLRNLMVFLYDREETSQVVFRDGVMYLAPQRYLGSASFSVWGSIQEWLDNWYDASGSKPVGIVIDLRGITGGLEDMMVFASIFVEDWKFGYLRYNGTDTPIRGLYNAWVKYHPIVILTDVDTAGPALHFARLLKKYRDAKIYGAVHGKVEKYDKSFFVPIHASRPLTQTRFALEPASFVMASGQVVNEPLEVDVFYQAEEDVEHGDALYDMAHNYLLQHETPLIEVGLRGAKRIICNLYNIVAVQ